MAQITHYMAHDPVGNSESYLTEFDSELISRAEASGIVFIAVYDDGCLGTGDELAVELRQIAL